MKVSNRYCLVSLIILLASTNLFAQHYTIYPNDSITANTVLTSTVTRNFNLKHIQTDTLIFHWKKLSVVIPTNWDAGICDYQHCYTTLLDSGITDKVIPTDDAVFSVHCTPYINTGTAIIRYTFYEKNSPQIIDTLTWIFNCVASGITNESAEKIVVSTFQQKIILQNVDENISIIKLYDESGREVFQTQKIKPTIEIQIPTSASHIYFIQFNSKQNSFIKKIIVN